MENLEINQIRCLYNRLAEKANTCRAIGAITDYRAETYFGSADVFSFKISVNETEFNHGLSWEAYRRNFGDDRDIHVNKSDADALNAYLEDAIAAVIADLREKKEVLDDYYCPTVLTDDVFKID